MRSHLIGYMARDTRGVTHHLTRVDKTPKEQLEKRLGKRLVPFWKHDKAGKPRHIGYADAMTPTSIWFIYAVHAWEGNEIL